MISCDKNLPQVMKKSSTMLFTTLIASVIVLCCWLNPSYKPDGL